MRSFRIFSLAVSMKRQNHRQKCSMVVVKTNEYLDDSDEQRPLSTLQGTKVDDTFSNWCAQTVRKLKAGNLATAKLLYSHQNENPPTVIDIPYVWEHTKLRGFSTIRKVALFRTVDLHAMTLSAWTRRVGSLISSLGLSIPSLFPNQSNPAD